MQSVCNTKLIRQSFSGNQAVFFAVAASFMLLAAAFASLTPIAFSIAIVFLFAGPHNWVELRYFISRLPSRFGPLRTFFGISFIGVLTLGASYALLTIAARLNSMEFDSAIILYKGWIVAFHAWLALLAWTRSLAPLRRKIIIAVLSATVITGLVAPLWFGLFLVYLHPLVGLAILDRELKRSRPGWLRPYRTIVSLMPFVILLMILQLCNSASLPTDTELNRQITSQAGSFLLMETSSHMLVSVHTFLEMLHYGVWLLAIPLATSAWRRPRWQPASMPVSRNSAPFKKILSIVFAVSSIVVITLWAAFIGNYAATRDFYFSVAVFHILAELPFLLWML